jgi:hypothetical protein
MRMIEEVIKDMKYFLLILLLIITAFSDAFLRISLGNSSTLDSEGKS